SPPLLHSSTPLLHSFPSLLSSSPPLHSSSPSLLSSSPSLLSSSLSPSFSSSLLPSFSICSSWVDIFSPLFHLISRSLNVLSWLPLRGHPVLPSLHLSFISPSLSFHRFLLCNFFLSLSLSLSLL